MRIRRTMLVLLAACSSVLLGAGAVGKASAATPSFTCYGGSVPPGSYSGLLIMGNCSADDVTVYGGVTVSTNATLHAFGDTIWGTIHVGPNGYLFLSASNVNGSIQGFFASGLDLHDSFVGGNILLMFGGGGRTGNPNCEFPFTAIEDNTINGNVNVFGLQSCWFGMFRNDIGGSVTVSSNFFDDPDATEIAENFIVGNLSCSGNTPHAQFGDGPPVPNTVTGAKIGECVSL